MRCDKGKVITATTIGVLPAKRKELVLTVSSLMNLIRGEHGCATVKFYGDTEDHNAFILIVEWKDRNALDRHLESETFKILLGSLRLLSNQAEVDFNLLSSVGGIELLTK